MRKFVKVRQHLGDGWIVGLEDNIHPGFFDLNFSLLLDLTETQANAIIKSLDAVYQLGKQDEAKVFLKKNL